MVAHCNCHGVESGLDLELNPCDLFCFFLSGYYYLVTRKLKFGDLKVSFLLLDPFIFVNVAIIFRFLD